MLQRLFFCALLAVSLSRFAAAQDKPNVIIIFNDDQGYRDLGCFGSPNIKTPNIDAMAREGMRFTDFMVASPVCTPSRAALMTGRYPKRLGLANGVLFPNSKKGLDPAEVTLADIAKEAGYRTACIGKWHLGYQDQFLPISQGFETYFGIPYSNDMWLAADLKLAADVKYNDGMTPERTKEIMTKAEKTPHKVPLMRGNEVIEFPCDQTTITRRYFQEAAKIVGENKDKPFFIYLANAMPHIPLFASPEFKGKSAAGLYGDTIEEIDAGVGTLMQSLRDNGIDRKTLVVFTSDNGPWLVMGPNGGSAQPLRNGKGSTFEGGQRVPCVMRWPDAIPAGTTCGELACTMDLLPTLCAILGREVPTARPVDGRSILDLMKGVAGAKTPHEFYLYYSAKGDLAAIRQGEWKLHADLPCFGYANTGESKEYLERLKQKPYAPELFNLKDDVGEKTDLAAEKKEIVERLQALLKEKAITD